MIVSGPTNLRGRRAISTLFVATLLMLFSSAMPSYGALAQFVGNPLSASDFSAFRPIAGYLTNSSWLLVTGQDPRLLDAIDNQRQISPSPVDQPFASEGLSQQQGHGLPVLSRSPSPVFSRNLLVTHATGSLKLTSDPQVALDPLDPEHLVLAVVDYNLAAIVTYITHDGGETWEGPRQVRFFAQDVLAGGPPDLAFDREGNVYLFSISFGVDDVPLGSTVFSVATPRIAMSKSVDGGITWSDPSIIVSSSIETTSFADELGDDQFRVSVQFLDNPSFAIGPDPDAPERDLMYVTYTDFRVHYSTPVSPGSQFDADDGSETTIRLVRSTDGGQRWSDPISVSPTFSQTHLAISNAGPPVAAQSSGAGASNAADALPGQSHASLQPDSQPQSTSATTANLSEDVVQGARTAVMADGTLVVAFLDTTLDGAHQGLAMIIVVVSSDGGRSFSEPVQAGIFREIGETPRNANFHYWSSSFPQLAVGPESEIYIVVTAKPGDRPTDDGDSVLFRSTNQGGSWEGPITLNSDGSNHLQFFPTLDVSADGTLHAAWGDMRNDPSEIVYDIYYSESTDQGNNWRVPGADQDLDSSDVAATDFASNSLLGFTGGRFLGDHSSLVASNSDVYLVWVDTRLGSIQAPNQQIGFTRMRPVVSSSLSVDPPAGIVGSDINVQGSGFQPLSIVFVSVGSANVMSLWADERGAFAATITLPFTTAGNHEISAIDQTGNRAVADFSVDVGLDTIAEGLGVSKAPDAPSAVPVATPES